MSTLVDFLLARVAEDEAQLIAHRVGCHFIESDTYGDCDCNGPSRSLAECAAKRRIIALASEAWDGSDCTECNEAGYMGDNLLRLLALPYADHPEYRNEWRPGSLIV